MFWLLLIGLIEFNTLDAFAQKNYKQLADSLLAQRTLKERVQSFYIKPIIEQYQSLVTTQGDGFSPPKGDMIRKRGFGLRIGYQWQAFEIETGLSTVMPVAGYSYSQNGIYGGYSAISRSTDFYHLPFIFRYRLWQPTRKLTFRVGAGAAYNIDLGELKLASTNNLELLAFDANGNKILLSRTSSQYYQQKSFFSVELNLSTRYELSRHFSAILEARRLIGPRDAVRLTAIQEQFDPSSIRTVEARGGTNSFSINVGLSYQFSFKSRYQLQ